MKIILIVLLSAGCTVFDEELTPIATTECTTNAECTTRFSKDSPTPAVCVKEPLGHCVQLTSEDCTTVTGDHLDDRAVLIATLLSTTGAQAATNLPRQQAAIMAVEEINSTNASGGILQSATPGDTRKLVMVSCDEAANLTRVATHLITDLKVSAIVGPNLSQDALDLTIGNPAIGLPSSAQAGVAMLSPTAVASAIATIPDNGLTFMMVPSDIQRVPLMKTQINALEAELKLPPRSRTEVKVAIYYRGDALGEGTLDGLTSLTINGVSLANAIASGKARADSYDPLSTNNSALVASYVSFLPDIVVVVGAPESIRYFISPLEAAWPNSDRPYYVSIDSTKVADLLTAVTGNDNLRRRFRGTGITTTGETQSVLSAFQIAYGQRWKDAMGNPQSATASGMGPAYDAVYTIALSLVGKTKVDGASIVSGMPRLATNTAACASDASGVISPCFAITDHSRTLYNNMGALLQNRNVTEIGTFGRLEWDAQGAKTSGLIEMWCINNTGPRPAFAPSGLSYDVKTQTAMGTYVQCGP